MSETKLVIFDLDGTLVDTSKGIFDTARYTAEKLGFAQDVPPERMRRFIGPPLAECFRVVYGCTDEQIAKAYPLFQERYRAHGQYLGEVYEGMKEVLGELRHRGYLLAVGTLKNEPVSLTLLAHFGLTQYFDAIHGDKQAGGRSKADVLEMILSQLHVPAASSVLVGDSLHDQKGAEVCGMPFVAASYGFGFPVRPAIGPTIQAVIDKPKDLLALFR